MSSTQLGLIAGRPASPAQPATPELPLTFDQLGLTPELLRAVAGQEYTEPTPVQAQSIPIVLAGRDLLASAQTGTGKTAAFVLPILQLLNASRPEPRPQSPGQRRPRGATGLPIRCLVLTPTRELALQIEECVRNYGSERPIRSTTIYGGVGFQPQVSALRAGPEIVVATPGRLLDHAGQGTIDLGSVEILVLDEADRMLDMGFIRDIRRIIALLPAQRQNLLFSATFSDEIRELAGGMLDRPAEVQIARRNAPIELVRQVVYPVDRERKRELLSHLIKEGRIDRALVFTRTKHGANRLAEQLEMDGIAATAIHGNKSQGQRVRALDDFKAGRVSILVATEVASRGLDIEGLPHVVNFELPMVAQDYVHRIGRTGRAGMEGDAVSLVCIDENMLLDDIQSLLRQPIRREIVPGFEVNRSIPREPIRQRSTGVYRPSEGRRAPARQAAPARPAEPAGIRNPAPAEFRQPAPAASRPPARNGTGFTPRQPVPTGIRQPAPSGFAARRPDPRGPRQAPSGEYRQAAAPIGFNQSAPVTPRRPAAGGFRRPMPSDFDRGPSSSSSQSRPSNGPANRQSTGRPAGGGYRQPERRYPAPQGDRRGAAPQGDRGTGFSSLPGERLARSGNRPD